MAVIRTQIATADIRRQAARRALDAQWFQQSKAALHAKQQATRRRSPRRLNPAEPTFKLLKTVQLRGATSLSQPES